MYTCMKCSSEKRDCLFLPCGHVTLCWECSSGATVCQICKGTITERTKASNSASFFQDMYFFCFHHNDIIAFHQLQLCDSVD